MELKALRINQACIPLFCAVQGDGNLGGTSPYFIWLNPFCTGIPGIIILNLLMHDCTVKASASSIPALGPL
jgi:hypothetical protein